MLGKHVPIDVVGATFCSDALGAQSILRFENIYAVQRNGVISFATTVIRIMTNSALESGPIPMNVDTQQALPVKLCPQDSTCMT